MTIQDLGGGKFKLPGVIDCHVHFRDPGLAWKEDFASGSRAAAAGGVSMVLDMPNTKPAVLTRKVFAEKRVRAAAESVIPVGLFFGATDNFEELKTVLVRGEDGVIGFKVFMGSSTGKLLAGDEDLRKIFEIARERDLPVVVHAEDEARIREGHRDCECARIATEKAIAIRHEVGNRLHIAHLSCKPELDLVREYRRANPEAAGDLTCEVAPHHLFFTQDDAKDSLLKMYPPLRRQEDVEALWEGTADGTVNCIATDHAPHTLEEKLGTLLPDGGRAGVGWEDAPAGVPGVEFMLPLMLDAVNAGRFSLERLVTLVWDEPRRIFKLDECCGGSLRDCEGLLVDMNVEKTITREMVKSKCGWSPYEGMTLRGWPVEG
jgi:dihydroorotase